MKLGNNLLTITILFFISSNFLYSEQRITTSPLLNIEEIKPSFEDLEEKNENISNYVNRIEVLTSNITRDDKNNYIIDTNVTLDGLLTTSNIIPNEDNKFKAL